MHPEEVRRHLRQQPFLPIRVFVSDGSTYDVHDPAYTYVSRREVVIGMDIGENQLPRRSAYLDPIHITRVEPLVNGEGTRPNGTR
jgi:hypothetical protein